MGCHALLQAFFPIQGWNPSLLHWQAGFLPLVLPATVFYSLNSRHTGMSLPELNMFKTTAVHCSDSRLIPKGTHAEGECGTGLRELLCS